MNKVIAFRESGWMAPNTDFRMWDHLCRAYGVELQMVNYWTEAEIPEDAKIIVVDEDGEVEINDLDITENCVFVFGRTGQNLMTSEINPDSSVKIDTPNNVSMFGISVGSIILQQIRS